MCGIVGFVSKEIKIELIEGFLKDITHRGPDSSNYSIIQSGDQFLHIGSARLSIRGDSREDMPMHTESGKVLVYNGEIFDINNLKKLLKNSKEYIGDTRMLLDLLDLDPLLTRKLNGMFSFAFYDNFKNKLYLGRDQLGIKPLNYCVKNNEIFFSSEMSSLVKYSGNNYSTEKESIEKLLIFGGHHYNFDFIKGIKTVQPGELIEVDLMKNNQIKNIKFNYKNLTEFTNIDFEELLIEVISDHLDADTPVDLFLSGGLDSSILALIIKNKLKRDVRHFSMSFENKSYDESENIIKISDSLHLKSHIFSFSENNLHNYVNDAIRNMHSLVLDYSFVPTFLLSKEASKHTKAVLSGDGADELFGGYEWYRGLKYFNLLSFTTKKIIMASVNKIAFKQNRYSYLSLSKKINYFFKYMAEDPYVQMLVWQSPYQNFDEKKVDLISEGISKYINSNISLEENYRNLDLNYFLYTNVLPKVDIASMSNSLEVRPPYLDNRIVNFAKNNLESNKVGYFRTKKYLRNYIDSTELKFLNNLPKKGFGFPISLWLEMYGMDEIKQLLKEKQLFHLDKDNEHLNFILNKENLSPNDERELWSYYIITKWFLENNISYR